MPIKINKKKYPVLSLTFKRCVKYIQMKVTVEPSCMTVEDTDFVITPEQKEKVLSMNAINML